jgi:putative CocE/NonD family hydrolase
LAKNSVGGYEVLENVWIGMSDGCRLAARIWLPDSAKQDPVPAILEFLPYRKRDGTAARDETNYPTFAEAGYAGVRVDMRGSGESEGLMEDEYSRKEWDDALEIIDWIAAQPWCSGKVGMMGISWGGFNSLQLAALAPESLKAVIALSTTVDRYNDDIHYKNGCLLNSNVSWAASMLSRGSRPPDPLLAGEGWRETWLRRMENLPPLIQNWFGHQRRDAYWKHGSICEDYSALKAPALVIGGWADGYKNAPPAAVAGLGGPSKAINGPWIHKYPHFAYPHPRIDFFQEALAWWDRWLKGEENGAEALPAYRAYITEGLRPSRWRERDPGRWVAEAEWPSRNIEPFRLHLNGDGSLSADAQAAESVLLQSPQDSGLECGEYFSVAPDGQLPGDQRNDTGGALLFQTAPLVEPLEILGRPQFRIRLALDAEVGNLIVRLIDVHPDGMSYRVSWGALNLAHRRGNETPQPMQPGKAEEVDILLDECGHRFLPGHRLQVAVSTAYWPLIQPPPSAVTATLELGAGASLTLPCRIASDDSYDFAEPGPPPVPSYRSLSPKDQRRWVERDLNEGVTRYCLVEDGGVEEIPGHGLQWREVRRETWSIRPEDPNSNRAELHFTAWRKRGEWEVSSELRIEARTDGKTFLFTTTLEGFEGAKKIYERRWDECIPRDFL